MAGTMRTGSPGRVPRLNLNSDGRPHPLLNVASFFTLVVGLFSFALGLFLRTGPADRTAGRSWPRSRDSPACWSAWSAR